MKTRKRTNNVTAVTGRFLRSERGALIEKEKFAYGSGGWLALCRLGGDIYNCAALHGGILCFYRFRRGVYLRQYGKHRKICKHIRSFRMARTYSHGYKPCYRIMLPMWMNFLLRTYSWMTILEDTGLINSLLLKIGFEPIKLINTRGAVVLGMVYNFLPYMVLPIYTVMLKTDRSLIEAAQDLGCNKLGVFKNVILPLSIPGVVSGFTMVFVPSVSTFYISQKLGGTGTTLIGDIIETQFQTANNFHLGAALSFVLMILIFICLAVMNRFSDEDGEVII